MLRINVDKVCYVADLATQLAGKFEPIYKGGSEVSQGLADDPGSDDARSPMLDRPGDPTAENLEDYLRALGSDELADLMAMVWLGRDEFEAEEWEDACDRADEEVQRVDSVQALLEVPNLGEHLLEALEELGYECPEDRAEFGAAGPGGSTDTEGLEE
jgi:hypothetical protein